MLITPTAIHPTTGSITKRPDDLAYGLFAHPEKAQGLSSVDSTVVAKELALMQRLADGQHDQEAERPEALVNAVSDFVERRETFIVGRQSGIINP